VAVPFVEDPERIEQVPDLDPTASSYPVMRENWHQIRSSKIEPRNCQARRYNIRIIDDQIPHLLGQIRSVMERQENAFKVAIRLAFMSTDIETGSYHYHYVDENTSVLGEIPFLVNSRRRFDELLRKLSSLDMFEICTISRDKSGKKLNMLTNCRVDITVMEFRPIAKAGPDFPKYLLDSRSVRALVKNARNKYYEDNLCFFRCIAAHTTKKRRIEKETRRLFREWLQRNKKTKRGFRGVTLNDMADMEEWLQLAISVYTSEKLDNPESEDNRGHQIRVTTVRWGSTQIYKNNICLHLYKPDLTTAHFSLITNLEQFANSFCCGRCNMYFQCKYRLQRHCNPSTKLCNSPSDVYKGGVYLPPRTVFEDIRTYLAYKLDSEGVKEVDQCMTQYYDKFITFDIETLLKRKESEERPYRETADHKLMSFGAASNVDGHDEFCKAVEKSENYPDGDAGALVKEALQYVLSAAKEAGGLMMERHDKLFEKLDHAIKEEDEYLERLVREYEAKPEDQRSKFKPKLDKTPSLLRHRLERYCKVVPVLGFNSGHYDLHVLQKHLLPLLDPELSDKDVQQLMEEVNLDDTLIDEDGEEHEDEEQAGARNKKKNLLKVIKQNGRYTSILTETLNFVDVRSYLPPNYNLSAFLESQDVSETKGYFCYEYIDNLDKLDERNLPPIEAFDSTLKNTKLTQEQYAELQRVWEDNNMTTVRDLLIWYNKLDVKPLLKAVENMAHFYHHKMQIDCFKQAVTCPGLSLRVLFDSVDDKMASIFTFNERDKDLHSLVKGKMDGGPSIIFTRYMEKGVSRINEHLFHENAKQCKGLEGWDANSLYLSIFGQDQLTGPYQVRRASEEFQPKRMVKYGHSAEEYLAWISHSKNIDLDRQFCGQGEYRVGGRKIPVDGHAKNDGHIYQFHGCHFHGHNCDLTADKDRDQKTEEMPESLNERLARTQEITRYFRSLGYTVTEMWECEWIRMKRQNWEIRDFIKKELNFKSKYGKMTEQEIIQGIQNETVTGIAQVDIEVPQALRKDFDLFPPLFKNVEISRDDIGDYMKQFAEENDVLSKPRKALISSMSDKEAPYCTDYLKWCLDHGLVITKVHLVVEFKYRKCFKGFMDKVTEARIDADNHPGEIGPRLLSDSRKLLGNSAYGKTVMDQAKFSNIYYARRGKVLNKLIENPLFKKLTPIDEDLYEVCMRKSRDYYSLPNIIGLRTYQGAKLTMLKFYYDFLNKYLGPENFQLCEMDTDSFYFGLSGEDLDSSVKEEFREEYEKVKYEWLPRPDVPADKRTPGKFKLEWRGSKMISLNSKTYFAGGPQETKIRMKGVQQRNNPHIGEKDFLRTLEERVPTRVTNKGFRKAKGGGIVTYEQDKIGLNHLYIKRKVLPDGINTTSLDL